MKRFLLVFTILSLILVGCSKETNSDKQIDKQTEDVTTEVDSQMFTNRDQNYSYDLDKCISINLSDNNCSSSSSSVVIKNNTITIKEEGTYFVSGSLTNGMIIVDSDDNSKIQIVFDNVNITSSTSSAIYILNADKVFITLADNSENYLANGGRFIAIDDNNIDAVIFSKDDLTLNGTGSLTISSPVGHGIVCKDDLVITSGSYDITCSSSGINANDSVRVMNSDITINSGKDGIHCENDEDDDKGFIYILSGDFYIEAEGDGISSSNYIQIEDGNFDLLVGGGSVNGLKASSNNYGQFKGNNRPGGNNDPFNNQNNSSTDTVSMKGIKATNSILINDGILNINSADDGIHSNNNITINSGTISISTGDDGIHADELLTINGSSIEVNESYEGLEAHKIYIEDGTILINSTDDGINASGGNDSSGVNGGRDGSFSGGGKMPTGNSSGVIEINGGKITIYASGDGLDSNGSLTINDGYIYVANPTAGDTSVIDSDISPIINGGIFISTGSTTMMAQTFDSNSKQAVIACTVGNQSKGSKVTVTDESGKTIISYDVEYNCVLLIISCPDLVKGETYNISIGNVSGDISAY